MTLDAALLAAHANHDGPALVSLYTQAAETAETENAACFYLTQAYVHALEVNDPAATALYLCLKAHRRI